MRNYIPRNGGNVNDKFGSQNWMVIPSFDEYMRTEGPKVYVDARKKSVYHDESISEFEGMDITEMLCYAVQKIDKEEPKIKKYGSLTTNDSSTKNNN